ncbi:MAG TPA: DNA-3-methyladenine glycosylase 2 family protein, partial [Methylomirabilota bacterium]|nr:DNA-3-methyladenine glycosylase 2 family protein [Methylomirabilota bacterium]
MSRPAIRHLSRVDPVMRVLIRRVGPCGLAVRNHSPFETLVRAIAHQQIHGRAAEAILGRFIALFPGRRFPTPDDIATLDARKMRRAGFSRAKTRSIKDIARKTRSGLIPTRRACHRLTDA